LTSARTLLIANNPALENLDGLSGLTSVRGLLQVSTNTSLTSLRALTGLAAANSMTINGNRSLPECDVEWLAKRVKLPTPSGQNGPMGACSL
jgi:hypothetical protein